MDAETIKKLISVVNERIRAHSEQMRMLSGMLKEAEILKETFVAKLKQAEQDK